MKKPLQPAKNCSFGEATVGSRLVNTKVPWISLAVQWPQIGRISSHLVSAAGNWLSSHLQLQENLPDWINAFRNKGS